MHFKAQIGSGAVHMMPSKSMVYLYKVLMDMLTMLYARRHIFFNACGRKAHVE